MLVLLLSVAVLGYTEVTNQRIIIERDLFTGAWHIAEQYNLASLYDAYYMALAQARDCDFWTADRRFLNSVPKLPYVRDIRDLTPGMLET